MKIIRPQRARTIFVAARLAQRKAPPRLVSTTLVNCSSDIRMISVSSVMPAFATSTSTGPSSFSIAVNAASTDSASETSQWTPNMPSGAPEPR